MPQAKPIHWNHIYPRKLNKEATATVNVLPTDLVGAAFYQLSAFTQYVARVG